MTIPVPSQLRLHKQWCLFDNSDNIDFDREVRKIAGPVKEEHTNSEINRQGKKIEDEPQPNIEGLETQKKPKDNTSSDLSVEEIDKFLSQLTLLDVQSPVKRDLEPLFGNSGDIKQFARGGKDKEKISMKNKRNLEKVKRDLKHKKQIKKKLGKASSENRNSINSKTVKSSKSVPGNKH